MQRYAISDGRYSASLANASAPEPPAPPFPPLRDAQQDSPTSSALHAALLRQARSLAAEEVDFFQLREKNLGAKHLAALARDLLAALRGSQTRLLINARPDVAIAVGAPGVHLPATPGSLTPAQVRCLYASAALPAPIVSQACHTLEEIAAAASDPPSLILFSPVFGKALPTGETLPGTGLDLLRSACALAHPIPVFALGGVTHENSAACLTAGARGVAGIRLFGPGHTG